MHSRSLRLTASIVGATALLSLVAGCGDDDGEGSASENSIEVEPKVSSIEVEGKDSLVFDSDEYNADAGTIDIRYYSDGPLTHNLLVEGHEDELELEIMGDEDEGSIDLEAGSYAIYCDIAGHREAGMESTLVVS
jgi:plastocyanin